MGEGWVGVLSSGRDGTYRTCIACRKCDRHKNDKSWPVFYIFCKLLIILAAIYRKTLSKKKNVILVVFLPSNKA